MAELMNIGISQELIKPIVEQHMKAAVIEAFSGSQNVLDKVIESVINSKVDKDNGKFTTSSYNSVSLLDYYFNEQIKQCAQEIIKNEVAKMQAPIRKSIINKLKSDKGASLVADALLDCIVGTFDNRWTSKINISLSKCSDE